MSSDLVELTVEEIAAGGDGVARLDSGRVVFVPRTAPGDEVIAELTENRARWARGRVVAWRGLGEGRVTPECPVYDECGGCRMQHLRADLQCSALARGVSQTLARIGGREVRVEPLEPSDRRYGYRNRVTFTLRRTDEGVVAGYHRLRGPRLVDVASCPLAEAPIREAWSALREGWGERAARLPQGRELRITLRASARGDVGLLVEGGSAAGEPDRLLGAVPGLRSYWWAPGAGPREHLGGAAELTDVWEGRELQLRPRAFLQVNRAVAAGLEEHLDEELGPVQGRTVLDLYAGVGTRALRWTAAGARVVAVEAEPDAVETGRDVAGREGLDLDLRLASVEESLAERPEADVIVVNPPRAGLHEEVSARLARARADVLVYVSCDAATLARDLRRLGDGWRPRYARLFDAFPQTGHVETVLWLEPAA